MPWGKSYSQWAREWVLWALSIRKAVNPIIDESGANCCIDQRPPVWFLAGTLGTSVNRKCRIPNGQAIFFPIIEKESSFAEEGDQLKTEEDLLMRAKQLMDLVVDIRLEIDGEFVYNLRELRFSSGIFDLSFPEQNIYDVMPGRTKSVTDGFWIMLRPLSKGSHVVRFSGRALIPDGPAAEIANRYIDYKDHLFETKASYELFIE